MRLFFVLTILVSSQLLSGQYISHVAKPDSNWVRTADENHPSQKYANTITAEDMRKHLTILASDEYEGRETGNEGNDKAAIYLGRQLNMNEAVDLVINRSPYQEVAFTFTGWDEVEMFVAGEPYRHLWEFLTFPNKNVNKPSTVADEIYFLGYGIDDPKYSDYGSKDWSGKVIIINKGEPMDSKGNSRITGTSELSDWSDNMDRKLKLAKAKGVALVLIIEDELKKMLAENRRFLLGPSVELGDGSNTDIPFANHAYVSTNIAKAIFGAQEKDIIKARKRIAKKGKLKPVKLKQSPAFVFNQMKNQKIIKGKNVIGFIEGDEKKEEIVVISAHYDHIGKRGDEVYNGADDNGSGTTALLEIMEAFAQAKKDSVRMKRSMLFLWVTGEEKGLLGSRYYTENPIYPLENTIVDINIDMVGRIGEKYQGVDSNYVYVIGSDRLSSELHRINEDINKTYSGMTLDYTYNDEADPNRYYYRSDHYNFARKGIPAIFFFNGVHEDYHGAGDEVEKISFDVMEKRTRHIFQLAWELANRENRISVDGQITP